MAPDQFIQMYADMAVVKSQTADILKILNDNGRPGLVSRMVYVENDIKDLKEKQESEENEEKITKNQKLELSGKIKVAVITGVIGLSINIILMAVNLLIEIFKT